ncbi:hybrid sensor histidine kinase/response regulator [Endothiovibrio diazotrophicus]
MQRLLLRQLKRTLGLRDEAALEAFVAVLQGHVDDDRLPAELRRLCAGFMPLLERVDTSYLQQERDLALRDRSLTLSTEELTRANQTIRDEAERQGRILETLRSATNQLLHEAGMEAIGSDDASLEGLSGLIALLLHDKQTAQRQLEQQKFALDQHAIVSITDRQGNILYANDKFCRISGYERKDLIGTSHRIVNAHYHDEAFFAAMWRTISAGEVWHGEIKNRSKDGSHYWVAATIVPIPGNDGTPEQYIAIRTDITQQKLLEEAISENRQFLQNVTDSMGEGIYALDTKGRCTFLNPEAERLLGWRREELAQRSFHDTVHFQHLDGTSLPAADCPAWLAISRGETYRSEEEHFTRRDGGLFPIAITAVPLRRDGEVVGQVAVFQDITERKEIEAQLREAIRQAEAANRSKSEFLANMSHEIRTPMNAVIGLSHLALQTDLTERQHGYLSKIQHSAKNLLGIINDILDFSKIEAGRMEVERTEFRLQEVIDQVTAVTALRAEEKGLEMMVSRPADLPVSFLGDPLRLGQVLTNLASNAVKFTERGDVTLAVEAQEVGDGRARLRFSVSDTGIGLSAEQVGRLFHSFSQADTSTTRKYGGTGLGLAISKHLVELMGGEIEVESEPGIGSCFHFVLPLGLPDQHERPLSEEAVELRGLRVLVVDDRPTAREVHAAMAASLGMRPAIAASGAACLEQLQRANGAGAEDPFRLLLLDWRMPELDGLETLVLIDGDEAIVHKPETILVTAYGAEELLRHASAGHLPLLTKPVTPSALLDTALELLGHPNARLHAAHTNAARDDEAIQGILGAHVLLVEDNAINRQVAGEMLESLGLRVSLAHNGREAVEAVAGECFDLVLMDVQMPEMDGFEATRRIRGAGGRDDLPIIALTAHAMEGDRERCLTAGMNDHISKPIDPEPLFDTLVRWIRPARRTPPTARPAERPAGELPELAIDGLDARRGLTRVRGNRRLYREVLERFAADYRGCDLAAELGGERDHAVRFAHTLKGVSATLGALPLSRAAAEVERLLREGGAVATAQCAELAAMLGRLVEGLDRALPPEAPADNGGEQAVDREQVGEALVRLDPLLAAGDLEALEVAEHLHGLLRATPFEAAAAAVKRHTGDFEFDPAREAFDALADALAEALNTGETP